VDIEAAQHPMLEFYLKAIERKKFFEHGQGMGADMTEQEVLQMRATYYGLMSEVDEHVGRVCDYLKQTGQWDNTLVVLTSDHGEQLGDHHLLGKLGYFDQSFHIPMIVRDPSEAANLTRGKIVRQFTETVDTMPTILEWMGLPVPRTCDGESLLPFIHGAEAPANWRTEVHYEFDFRNIFYSKPEDYLGLGMDECSLSVIQNDRYKYVHFAALPPLFFDLENDPHQLRNLAQDPAYASQMLDMAQKMLNWRLKHADRTLTGYAATPEGLLSRL
jgi:arylsulfatase A-like enzyme